MNITENAKNIIDNCRFCWMCRHVCPIGNATGLERNTARARAFGASMVVRGATDLAEIADNLYECSLCGACTNNCVTGFDPKVFIQQFKTELAPEGLMPDSILFFSVCSISFAFFSLIYPVCYHKAGKKATRN